MKKSVVSSFVIAVVTAPAWAADAPGPAVDRLVACSDVQDSQQRLVCFDREIAPLAKARVNARNAPAPGPTATPPVVAPPARAAAPSPAPAPVAGPAIVPPSFGQEQLDTKSKPAAREEEQVLHGRIASLRTAGAAYQVALDNGQTWRHEDQTLGVYLKEGDAVTIRKGTLGGYRLTRDAGNEKNWIRVTRIR